VTDSGTPALSATRSFQIVAGVGFEVSGIERQPNGEIALTIGATVGKRYRVEYKENLGDPEWTTLVQETPPAASTTVQVTDPNGSEGQRFYRVVELD
jgi:hypothetical protein